MARRYQGAYRKGDPAPEGGYAEWHSWADVQHKAGLGQSRCSRCGLYQFPQEMTVGASVCRACAGKGVA
jgi:hypothetical protein